MGRTVFLSENFWNPRIFPSHTFAASTTASGWDVEFVGTGRRQADLNRWEASTYNADAYIQVTMDRVRSFDFLALDRGHNLDGYPIQVRVSSDAFSTYQTISGTVPTQVFPYGRLSDNQPILTEEGAILWSLGNQAGKAARVFIPAMGAGLRPKITGAYLGQSFTLTHARVKPWDFGQWRLVYNVERSPQAWAAAGEIGALRVGTLRLRLADRAEYARARYHIESLYLKRKPMWVIHDDDEAEKSLLAVAPPGDAGFEIQPGQWSEFQGEIPYEEHEPRIVGATV